MADEKKLDIGIKVAADTAGATQTTAALKQVDLTASKTYNNIAVAQAKAEIAQKNQTAEEKDALQARAQLELREIERRESEAKAIDHASGSLKELGKTTKEVSKLGEDLGRVTEGLARGDLAGLAQAGRGVKDALAAVAEISGGVLLPAITAVAGVFAIFKSALSDSQQAIARYYKNAATASETYKAKLEAATAANAKLVDQQVKDIKRIAAAYDEVTAAIDKAYARQQKIDTAKAGLASAQLDNAEKKAVAAAKTPEQKAAVEQQFSDKRLAVDARAKFQEFNTVDDRAGVDITNAREAQQKAAEENQQIEAARAAAKEKADQSTATAALLLGKNGATGPTLQAQAEARADAESLKQLLKETEESFKSNSEIFAKSQEKIDAATASKEENAINRDTFRQTLTGKQIDQQQAAKDTQKEIGKKLQDANDNGTDVTADVKSLRQKLGFEKGTSGLIGNLLGEDAKNQDTSASQAAQRARAGIVPVKVAGADGKPDGGAGGTIQKDGQEIKVTGQTTVAELKKVSATLADSSKDIAKATPAITKAAAATADAIGKYHSNVIEVFNAQGKRIDSLSDQVRQLAQAQQALADRGS